MMPEPQRSENPAIKAAVVEAIRLHGPLTFAAFMELALYHPQLGYYRRPRIGRDGDYYTAASVGPVWGRIWARYFRRMMGTGDRQLYEFGGNTGAFRADVLAECPELNHRIIEAGDPMPDAMAGIVFSNELIDALPFHRLRMRDGAPREVFIAMNEQGGLVESEGDPSPGASGFGFPASALPDGWEFEVRPAAEAWIRAVASRLMGGFVITVDYGCTHDEYFAKPRPEGTWRTYFRHTQTGDALANIGEQDITADVDFTSFIAAGEAAGLETILFQDQSRALLDIGRDVIGEIVARDAGRPSKERNALHQLLHPSLMGRRFKVLIQRKTG